MSCIDSVRATKLALDQWTWLALLVYVICRHVHSSGIGCCSLPHSGYHSLPNRFCREFLPCGKVNEAMALEV